MVSRYFYWLFQPCDFQKYKNIIIPPACVEIEKGKILKIKPVEDNHWEPLIIFGMLSVIIIMCLNINGWKKTKTDGNFNNIHSN